MKTIAVLFTRSDSFYKTLPGCDVYDIDRDARSWAGGSPVVAHPPCRAWGRLFRLANPRPDEKDLARTAVSHIRKYGGVLEHPEYSKLWADQGLPKPGQIDAFGGHTLPIAQSWFGHRATKKTWLYIVGVTPSKIPAFPLVLGEGSHVISSSSRRKDGTRLAKGDQGWRPEVTRAEREHTPPALAVWLVELARKCEVK